MSEVQKDFESGRISVLEKPVRGISLQKLKSLPEYRFARTGILAQEENNISNQKPLLMRLLDHWEDATKVTSVVGTSFGVYLAGGNYFWPLASIPPEQTELGLKIWAGTIALTTPLYAIMGIRSLGTKLTTLRHGRKHGHR